MKKPVFALLCLCYTSAFAQGNSGDSLSMALEMQGSFSNSKTPLWLNANKYGLSSLTASNGYVRGIATYNKDFLDGDLDLQVGADVALPVGYKIQGYNSHYTQKFIIQQAFVEMNWKYGVLTIGSKQQPMELKNNELSSGSQTFGINSTPIPQVRLGLNRYWAIPYTKDWLSIKTHIAFGIMTDAPWETSAAKESPYKYNRYTRYHQKAGYLRIGNEEKFPLSLTLGLENGAQFGGSVYNWSGTDENGWKGGRLKFESKVSDYWNAFVGGGSDVGEDIYSNAEGNNLGSWVARLNWNDENIEVGAYCDHFFEDHSSMFLLDYDGYGSGDEWNVKKDNHYFRYDMKDALVGIDVKFKKFPYVNQAVVEYMNTRYQCGPIYHDHTRSVQTHISGRDNYYNHLSLPGWQHWGQVIGNPLFTSPIYNEDGYIGVRNNRFKAWHFALAGDPVKGLHYRMKLTWEKGYGTYDDPYLYPKENTSIFVETSYRFPKTRFTCTLAFGSDSGELLGDNTGVQMTVKYNIK